MQFDQRLRCSYEETLHSWLSTMRTVKIPIRLRECVNPYWGAHVCPKICCTCSDAAADSTSCNYRIYPKYSDTSTPYHICSKIWTSTIHYPMLCLKIAGWVANSVDPDGTPRSAASHLGLYCLLRPVCPNTYSKLDTTKQRVWFCELWTILWHQTG